MLAIAVIDHRRVRPNLRPIDSEVPLKGDENGLSGQGMMSLSVPDVDLSRVSTQDGVESGRAVDTSRSRADSVTSDASLDVAELGVTAPIPAISVSKQADELDEVAAITIAPLRTNSKGERQV